MKLKLPSWRRKCPLGQYSWGRNYSQEQCNWGRNYPLWSRNYPASLFHERQVGEIIDDVIRNSLITLAFDKLSYFIDFPFTYNHELFGQRGARGLALHVASGMSATEREVIDSMIVSS